MPITLQKLSRRGLLVHSAAACAAICATRLSLGDPARAIDPHHVALLSDIHIAADLEAMFGLMNMADHLRQTCNEVLKLSDAPACAIVNGDCARLKGEADDYVTMVKLLKPLMDAGMPLHLALGNHDRRDHFWAAVADDAARQKALPDRQVLVLESPRVDWIVLDSLQKTNATPGEVGAAQRKWLADELDRRTDKPVIVMVHHNPQTPLPITTQPTTAPTQPSSPQTPTVGPTRLREAIASATAPAGDYPATAPATFPTTLPTTGPTRVPGLVDADEVLDILLPRRQVKALLFGHTHVWELKQRRGMHLINLPAVAYVFNPLEPCAWVDAHVEKDGIFLDLRCLNPDHPWHRQKAELKWR